MKKFLVRIGPLLFVAMLCILAIAPRTGSAEEMDDSWLFSEKHGVWHREVDDDLTLEYDPREGPQYRVTLRCENGLHETIAWREGDLYGITHVGCNGKSGEPRFIGNLRAHFDSLPHEARHAYPPAEIDLDNYKKGEFASPLGAQ